MSSQLASSQSSSNLANKRQVPCNKTLFLYALHFVFVPRGVANENMVSRAFPGPRSVAAMRSFLSMFLLRSIAIIDGTLDPRYCVVLGVCLSV